MIPQEPVQRLRPQLHGLRYLGTGRWSALCPVRSHPHAALTIIQSGPGGERLSSSCGAGCREDELRKVAPWLSSAPADSHPAQELLGLKEMSTQPGSRPASHDGPASAATQQSHDTRSTDSLPSLSSLVSQPHGYPSPPAQSAFHGILGDIVRTLAPHTEADPAALLLQSLVMFGSVIGRGVYYLAEADRHYTNLFVCLVGLTAKGRKGVSRGRAASVFRGIDEKWMNDRTSSGLSSGEGLIHEVRDAIPGGDAGAHDKRLLVVEEEFASVLRVMTREGNTLSAVIRQAWDNGMLNTLVKHSPTRATAAHISIIGHITADELRRYLDRTEAGNGFANRILWACVRRSRLLPFGGALRDEDLAPARARLAGAVRFARGLGEAQLPFNSEAVDLWAAEYPDLSEGKTGLLGAVTSRAEAQTVRLALLYALTDCSREIGRPHLEAALALWRYCYDSARFIFGDALGDPVADEILEMLRRCPVGMTRTEIRDAFGRHKQLDRPLSVLLQLGVVRTEKVETTGGRPAERWFATEATKATK